jgi:hypothetical protein
VTDEEELVALIKSSPPGDAEVGRVSQTALHDGFASIAEECDLGDERVLRWLYGLLCVLEKPLLPDQAADLNVILQKLKSQMETKPDLKANYP